MISSYLSGVFLLTFHVSVCVCTRKIKMQRVNAVADECMV